MIIKITFPNISPSSYIEFCFLVLRESGVVLKFQNGKDLTVDTFEKNGFNRPILITNKEGLGMTVPDKNFSVMDVERCVGMFMESYIL